MTTDVAGSVACPDCGSALNFTIEGFRPATADERSRLSTEAIRVLGLCPNGRCPGRAAALPRQRAKA